MKNILNRFKIALVVFALLFSASTFISASSTSNEFVILHTNDVHGQIDPNLIELAYLKAYKDKVDATFVFDAGDASQGLPLNNITKGVRLAEIYNLIDFDAVTLGNHEFDYTRDLAIAKDKGYLSTLNSTVVSSNIYYNEEAFSNEVINTPVFNTSVQITKEINDEDVMLSVLGVTTPETKFKADPRNSVGLDFRDPLTEVKRELAKGLHKDSDYIVILAHLGVDNSTKKEWRGDYLAEELSKDKSLENYNFIIIDGHSHTAFENGGKFGKNVIYGQTGGLMQSFGEIIINTDDFTKSYAKLINVRDNFSLHDDIKDLKPDVGVMTLINNAANEFEDLAGYTVIDNLNFTLNGEREAVRSRETNLGNLISDSMYYYAKERFKNTDLAVINGGGIRASLNAGKVTFKDLLKVIPFGNRIVQIEVSGMALYEMFEHALKAPIDNEKLDDNGIPILQMNPSILHASNTVKVNYDPRLEAGKRVEEILINNVSVDLNKTYNLATHEFLAVGGDGFTMLKGKRLEGENDADVLKDYLLNPQTDLSFYENDSSKRVVSSPYFEKYASQKLNELLSESYVYNIEDKYTNESYKTLINAQSNILLALDKLEIIDKKLTELTYEDYKYLENNLDIAISNLVEKTVTVPDTEEVIKDDIPKDSNITDTVETSVYQNEYLYIILITIAALSFYLLKRKKYN